MTRESSGLSMNTRPEKDLAMSYPDEGTGIPARWNAVTERVIGLAMEVHSILGPGLAEKLYENALVYELARASIAHQRQVVARVSYKDILLSEQRFDLVVAGGLVVDKAAPDWPASIAASGASRLDRAREPLPPAPRSSP